MRLTPREAWYDPAAVLLDQSQAAVPWFNLGKWSGVDSYAAAATALARQLGEKASLDTAHTMLDLGCAFGASLLLWRQEWQVQNIDALEARADCRSFIQTWALAGVRVLPYASEALFWQSSQRPTYDAIVSVDAAYHFSRADAFIRGASASLRLGGRLAFTTLMRTSPRSQPGFCQQVLLYCVCQLARIPQASLLSQEGWQEIFERETLTLSELIDLSDEVLTGFADYIDGLSLRLKPSQKWQIAWLKIALTARWARWLVRGDLLRYVLIVGSKA